MVADYSRGWASNVMLSLRIGNHLTALDLPALPYGDTG